MSERTEEQAPVKDPIVLLTDYKTGREMSVEEVNLIMAYIIMVEQTLTAVSDKNRDLLEERQYIYNVLRELRTNDKRVSSIIESIRNDTN